MVMIVPEKHAVIDAFHQINGVTSRKLRLKFTWLHKAYFKEGVVRSPGYFVSTIVLDEITIIEYLKWQERKDLGQT